MTEQQIKPSIECTGWGQTAWLTPRGCLAIQVMRNKQYFNPCIGCEQGLAVLQMDLGLRQVNQHTEIKGWLLSKLQEELKTFTPGIKKALRHQAQERQRTLEEEVFHYLQEA